MAINRRTRTAGPSRLTKPIGFWTAQWILWSCLSAVDLVLRLAIYKNPVAAVSLTVMLFPAALFAAGGMRAAYRRFRPEDRSTLAGISIVLAVSGVTALAFVLLASALRHAFGWSVPYWDLGQIWALFGTYHLSVLLGWGLGYVWLATSASRRLAREQADHARSLAVRSELDKLRVQLEPHFLFNALNGVGTEIVDHPDRALTMVRDLADFVRYSLRTLERPTVTVAEELEALAAYLAIQQARFGPQLHLNQQIDPRAGARHIASYLLQPLVENACEHGGREPDMQLAIQIEAQDEALTIHVRNRGSLETTTPKAQGGLGLRNLRRRLQWHYPERHRLVLQTLPSSEPGGASWVCATLQLEGQPCFAS